MKTAMEIAGITKYIPTAHALERASLRFGIAESSVSEWINGLMAKAKYLAPSAGRPNCSIYAAEDMRFVIDEVSNAVVTIYSEVSADFLRPTLDRELRKLRREQTRNKRRLELDYAEAMRELADMAINRARARNPQTRELIGERMANKQAEIDAIVYDMERLDDEYMAKIRAIELIAE